MLSRRLIAAFPSKICSKTISTSSVLQKFEDKHAMLRSLEKKDEGVQGEMALDFDVTGYAKFCEFPNANTPNRLFNNVPFKEIPVINIRATRKNTLLSLANYEGRPIYSRSCGVDGFKNCRKGTNVAAQVTAQAFAVHIQKLGYKMARVCINGIGPGRMSSLKGL